MLRDPERAAYKLHKYVDGPAILEAAVIIGGGISWMPVARLPHVVWEPIATDVHQALVKARRAAGVKTLRPWGAWTGLQRHEGLEVLVLMFGLEGLNAFELSEGEIRTKARTALANWCGLAPEERWWLASQTEATRGRPGYAADRGWRQALKHILLENPV